MDDETWGDKELPTVFISDHEVPEGGLRLTFEPSEDDAYFEFDKGLGLCRVYIRPSKYEGGYEILVAHQWHGYADHTPGDLVRSEQSLVEEFGDEITDILDEVVAPTHP